MDYSVHALIRIEYPQISLVKYAKINYFQETTKGHSGLFHVGWWASRWNEKWLWLHPAPQSKLTVWNGYLVTKTLVSKVKEYRHNHPRKLDIHDDYCVDASKLEEENFLVVWCRKSFISSNFFSSSFELRRCGFYKGI